MAGRDIPSSFRDPSGFVFSHDGQIYRQINVIYKDNYDHLMTSGLYQSLIAAELMISHQEVDNTYPKSDQAHRIIKPEPIPFISYPYEWCFSQLKDAALTTLKIQRAAVSFGMTLKDCSAYNIQFNKGKPQWIDTLSFSRYQEGEPWVAHRQFCQHFLGPLTLMSYKDARLSQLLRSYIDGIPLDLTSSLLPFATYFRPFLLLHIHVHARSQAYYSKRNVPARLIGRKFGLRSFLGLIDSLESSIRSLRWRPQSRPWACYYEKCDSYVSTAVEHKKQIVSTFLDQIRPRTVWDVGANTGLFSSIASDKEIPTIAFDADPASVEAAYLTAVAGGKKNILPLVLDLTNPSPKIGWQNEERMSIFDRGPADTVLALALIHHLAIANNVPLEWLATFFSKICTTLIIEFVPKSDSKVQELLATREDIFPYYNRENFENGFSALFTIRSSVPIRNSGRVLYWMERR